MTFKRDAIRRELYRINREFGRLDPTGPRRTRWPCRASGTCGAGWTRWSWRNGAENPAASYFSKTRHCTDGSNGARWTSGHPGHIRSGQALRTGWTSSTGWTSRPCRPRRARGYRHRTLRNEAEAAAHTRAGHGHQFGGRSNRPHRTGRSGSPGGSCWSGRASVPDRSLCKRGCRHGDRQNGWQQRCGSEPRD